MLKFYWSLGEDICEKQKQYKWGANFMKRLSLDLRAEFPQAEGFSWSNLYKIRKWYLFYSSQIEFLYQAGTKLQKVDNANTPIPDILLGLANIATTLNLYVHPNMEQKKSASPTILP